MEVKCTLLTTAFEDLSKQDQEILNAAKQAASRAFAPYSDFRVGAAARMSNGEIVIESNQENIAYPSGLCGERVAMFSALSSQTRSSDSCNCNSTDMQTKGFAPIVLAGR